MDGNDVSYHKGVTFFSFLHPYGPSQGYTERYGISF
jgi:hypothetical protein